MALYDKIFDASEKKSIESIRFSKISTSIANMDIEGTLALIHELLDEEITDIRLIIYACFCNIFLKNLKDATSEIEQLNEVIEQKHEILTPEKNLKIHLKASCNWFYKNLIENIGYRKEEKQISPFDFSTMSKALKNFNKILEEKFELTFCNDQLRQIDKLLSPYQINMESETEPEIKDEEETIDSNSNINKEYICDNSGNESPKWQEFKEKIYLFKSLMEKSRFLEASLFYIDIQDQIKNFDPRFYFPELFSCLYESMAHGFDKVISIISERKNTIEWHIVKEMYNVDYKHLYNKSFDNTSSKWLDSFTDAAGFFSGTGVPKKNELQNNAEMYRNNFEGNMQQEPPPGYPPPEPPGYPPPNENFPHPGMNRQFDD